MRNKTPKQLYLDHKHHSKERNIKFNLTYSEWLELWLVSGKWEQRGKKREQYQLCRYQDKGSYSIINCYIGTVEENQKERHKIPDGETGKIIKMWLSGKYSQRKLGLEFGLSQGAISKIVNYKRRSHEIYT